MHFCTRNLIILLVWTQGKGNIYEAGVAKLVDAPDLGSGAARRGGSSPSTRTTFYLKRYLTFLLRLYAKYLSRCSTLAVKSKPRAKNLQKI